MGEIGSELEACVQTINVDKQQNVNTYLKENGEESLKGRFQDTIDIYRTKHEDVTDEQLASMFDLYDIYLGNLYESNERDTELLDEILSSECKIAFASTEEYYRKTAAKDSMKDD